MEKCTACGAFLIWAITPSGAKSPIDYAPSDEGNVALGHVDGLGAPLVVVMTKGGLERARQRSVLLRTNHFATCPNAAQFKR